MEQYTTSNYANWLTDWKKRIQSAQIKAALQVNRELLLFYWELGRDIAEKQQIAVWGDGLIPRFAKDLKEAFPNLKGFSQRNLFYIRKWYLFYRDQFPIVQQVAGQLENIRQVAAQTESQIVPQVVAQLQIIENELTKIFPLIPWGHHRLIMTNVKILKKPFLPQKNRPKQLESR